MATLSKINKKLIKINEFTLAVLLFVAVLFILAQVFFRYVLHHPLDWTEQSSRYLFIWMMMLGSSIVFYRDSAMQFDLILNSSRPKSQFVFKTVIFLLIILFSCYYGYQGLVYALRVIGRYTSGVRVPLTFMYSSMFFSNLFVVMVVVEKLLIHLKRGVVGNKEGI